MKYELVYYKNNKKYVEVSGSLEKIDKYIIESGIEDENLLSAYVSCGYPNDIDSVKIISNDDKYTRQVLYYNDLMIIHNKDFLDKVYELYITDSEFKDKFDKEILFKILDIKKDASIKKYAEKLLLLYPKESAFKDFYYKYFDTKIKTDDKKAYYKYSYSRYRKFGELYINHINKRKEDDNVKVKKSNKVL